MPSRSHRLAVAALTMGGLLLSGCGSSLAESSTRGGSTLVTFDADATCQGRQVTGLVTRSDRGCFQLDGYPLTFPSGSSWAGPDGTAVRLPSGADVRDGDVVSGQMCTAAPVTEWAGYQCGIKVGDPVHGLVGAVSVEPRG